MTAATTSRPTIGNPLSEDPELSDEPFDAAGAVESDAAGAVESDDPESDDPNPMTQPTAE
ncbi:MAG: hypothetical protein H6512_13980 [Acidimicrobiia bacterium]|nr:hypothetical protein [Acidimicrobiia bacterium]